MIRFTSKIEQALKQGRKEGREEGREEGRQETRKVYRAWADWNKRREEAAEKGTSFDEPPPPDPENGTGKQ